ncbi:MAG: shikimate dehydrogenase [Acetobacteraceae bacterium]|nr:shikimate dehydrogenase [Acetobacteraceae bacterium]
MTDLYAVIGNPIGHTKSPLIHLTFARETGQHIEYIAIEAPIGGFNARVDELRLRGGLGLNITAPFKLDAFAYATELSEDAKLAGAVNCLGFEGDRVTGQNYDGVGLVNDIVCNLRCPIEGKRVLMLGAGGAVRGALLPFLAERPEQLVLVNRTVDKARSLAGEIAAHGAVQAAGYDALQQLGPFDLVLNATSASVHGEGLPIPAASFASGCLAYDLAYGKGLTPFLRLAREAGVRQVADGVGMLVEQAAEAFAWWRGVRPDTRAVIERLTVPLT